jgi:hypothetical protein
MRGNLACPVREGAAGNRTSTKAGTSLSGLPRGARNLPCDTFARNAIWLQLVLAAQDLMCFMQNLCLDGDLRLAEPQRLRYQILHMPARIVTTGRRVIMRIQHDWPWAQHLLTAYARLRALPLPAT